MRRLAKLALLAGSLCLAACGPKIRGTWRASHPNENQPAIAMELTRLGSKYSGAMYLLNPDTPNDFTSGKSYPITIKNASDQSIRFTVEFLAHEPDDLILDLHQPVDGPTFSGTLHSADGRGSNIDLDFTRLPVK